MRTTQWSFEVKLRSNEWIMYVQPLYVLKICVLLRCVAPRCVTWRWWCHGLCWSWKRSTHCCLTSWRNSWRLGWVASQFFRHWYRSYKKLWSLKITCSQCKQITFSHISLKSFRHFPLNHHQNCIIFLFLGYCYNNFDLLTQPSLFASWLTFPFL